MNNFHHYTSTRFRQFPKSFSLRRKVPWWYQILDPGSEIVTKWNRIFLVTCLIALFVDPLYFFVPIIGGRACMQIDFGLGVLVTFFRTMADLFFLMHMMMKFRTAFVAPSSRVLGKGELVMDSKAIALRYLKSDFFVDFAAMLPLPQIVIWFVIPAVKNPTADNANHTLSLMVLIQYIPRLYVMFPLNRRIIKTTGVVARTAWSGAVYNLLLYILASHVLGASWYLVSIQRQHECWSIECVKEMNSTHSPSCNKFFLDCSSLNKPERVAWLRVTHVLSNCDAQNDENFQFGMFADAFINDVASSAFIEKYFYCLWWGLSNLSSYGQNLTTSTYSGETLFSILICIAGLVMFSHLIGNMQTYLQSSTARLEEWRIRRRDTEEWMRHRQLPPELQERVRHFVQYKWLATRGVDEESILKSLPVDIRRQIQRHLCLALVRRVPFFARMDVQLLDAICERLVSSLNTKSTYIVREGDPVNEMLFIIRGKLESSTTNGGRIGFFNSITLGPGDFCGEELLTWALMPTPSLNLPLSTRTVKATTEVEAFALRVEDLKYVANQFKRLHSKKLQHAFRYYSHQWRNWGATFVQAAWKRYAKKKKEMELARMENLYYMQGIYEEGDYDGEDSGGESSSVDNANRVQHLGATMLASKFAANTRRGVAKQKPPRPDSSGSSLKMPKLFKPQDPDFASDS
ncbi:Cyclic nucleotide-gated channel 16 [Tripterygium wilfordii]|uniref:Cyclic nucleotide-gated channel 16 n=1 Tax=Tripterygium wilfordii TaxID=458696 RepID=A0A7J7CJF7_TRIWF|nr:probable cyclic nucleotide-gated ion channel 16 [Tripterygium wilfordii]KAF5734190.1 Cyclic nucleotide-gated channel 16 [Tripterygium wilfordii]